MAGARGRVAAGAGSREPAAEGREPAAEVSDAAQSSWWSSYCRCVYSRSLACPASRFLAALSASSLVAPDFTLASDGSRSTLGLLHSGHTGTVDARMSASNWWPHAEQE